MRPFYNVSSVLSTSADQGAGPASRSRQRFMVKHWRRTETTYRRFDAYHCLILASCHDLEQEFDSSLRARGRSGHTACIGCKDWCLLPVAIMVNDEIAITLQIHLGTSFKKEETCTHQEP